MPMTVLGSYVGGSWIEPSGAGRPLYDAVTGEPVAALSTAGIDMAAVVAHGRDVGGPELRGMGFRERAELLRSLGQALREHREQLYELSTHTGATHNDARLDIDGGIAVLLGYAARGRRELPPGNVFLEGDAEALGKGGTFLGQHVLTPLRGVAVQVNAYNFPVWGPLEKLAPSFLAGVPSIVKPASPTAFLTHRLVEIIVETGILPPGSLQLVAGGVGNLFDHLGEQDLVSFTGSAATARRLRTHPTIAGRSVRFTAEADSLNASVLGPDATPGTPELALFVDQLVSEMTVKAGQKCTAIRRALVPESMLDAVAEAMAERLGSVVVGHPADPSVTMGALAGLEQREEVRRSLKALLDVASVIFGDPERVEVLGADADRGAFMSPVLLRAEDPERAEFHEVEAFGPISTLIGYRDAAHAVALTARGAGSLVASVVSHDAGFVEAVVTGLAPWHGRILVLDRDDVGESTGHGSPLPGLVHGGPGRAGGCEELGGLRGVAHHMQRTALQASPKVLGALTGRWLQGCERSEDIHPFRKSLAELRLGDAVTAGPRRVTLDDIGQFAELTGDTFYVHTDAEKAAANPFFDGIVAHGYLVLSLAAGLFVTPEPGPVLANYGIDNLRFLTPVYPDDELTVSLTCKQITPRAGSEHGEVRWDAEVVKQDGSSVARYDVLTMVANEWPRA